MPYHLWKVGDPCTGDSGGMSMALWDEGEQVKTENDARPQVGKVIRVGSIYARSYQQQDWWQTSEIKEILEESQDRVKFLTNSGSTYVWEIK